MVPLAKDHRALNVVCDNHLIAAPPSSPQHFLQLARYILLTDISDCGIYHAMIQLRINEVLEQRGQTIYWLWKQTGIRYATVWQLGKGEAERLSLDVLDRICEALECQPGDLLVRVETSKKRKRGK